MGLLIDGQWHDQWYDTDRHGGRFKRQEQAFRHWVTPDGQPGPSGDGGFAAEPGRYHLYVSYACPWAHRTLIFRALKGLDQMIDVSVVHWHMGSEGWTFEPGEGVTGDKLMGLPRLQDVYLAADPNMTGRVTVPILWDTQRGTIVNNESLAFCVRAARAWMRCSASSWCSRAPTPGSPKRSGKRLPLQI